MSVLDDADSATRDGRDARWDAHRARRRDELVDAALRAIRLHGGSPSMDEIAELAGTSKAALYRHFDDQAGLFMAVAHRIDATIQQRMEAAVADLADPQARLIAMIDQYLELLEADPEIYRFLENKTLLADRSYEYPTPELVARMTELFADTFVGDSRTDTTPMLMAGIISLVRTATQRWITTINQPKQVPRAEFARDLSALLWLGAAGLGANESARRD